MFCKQRLYLVSATASAAAFLVAEGDKRGETLYASPGDEIPASAVAMFGLEDGRLPDATADHVPDRAPLLTDIPGIGAATAKHLIAGGVVDVAALAALDPIAPPPIEGINAGFAWPDAIAAAKGVTIEAQSESQHGGNPEEKDKPAPPNKERAPGEDKERRGGGRKAKPAPVDTEQQVTPPAPPALDDITGIGASSAEALRAGGIADVAALAAIDPDSVPSIDGIHPGFDWQAVITTAREYQVAPAQAA